MLLIRIVAAVAAFLLPTSVLAQEWTEYIDRTERFSINFPGQPTIRDTTYPPQRGAPVPARVFTVQAGRARYSVTVVNLATVVQPSDVKGSVSWEAWNFRKRGGEITYDAFAQVDRIDGHQLHITNSDKSLTVVGIFVHARRLYILEADVPPDTPGAVHFQQSLMILDEDGKRIRYELDADGNRLFRITNLDGIC
jgi:hypothetical protein